MRLIIINILMQNILANNNAAIIIEENDDFSRVNEIFRSIIS